MLKCVFVLRSTASLVPGEVFQLLTSAIHVQLAKLYYIIVIPSRRTQSRLNSARSDCYTCIQNTSHWRSKSTTSSTFVREIPIITVKCKASVFSNDGHLNKNSFTIWEACKSFLELGFWSFRNLYYLSCFTTVYEYAVGTVAWFY